MGKCENVKMGNRIIVCLLFKTYMEGVNGELDQTLQNH